MYHVLMLMLFIHMCSFAFWWNPMREARGQPDNIKQLYCT